MSVLVKKVFWNIAVVGAAGEEELCFPRGGVSSVKNNKKKTEGKTPLREGGASCRGEVQSP